MTSFFPHTTQQFQGSKRFIPWLLFLLAPCLAAQVTPPPDSSEGNQQISPIKQASVGLSKPVEYTYKTMITETGENGRITELIGDATVKYGEVTITAGKITIRWNDNLLIAETLADTSDGTNGVDSLSTKQTGLPTFSDGRETMVGERMEFNFKTERGRVLRGRTEFQQGYYQGGVVKRVEPKVFNVANGMYSTCDKEEPHFHFRGKKMKVIVGDKVIAKPVIFFIGNIPLAIFPFAMFPTKDNGRSSGLILPQFGTSPAEGRYLRELGYYWATNDYMDMRFTLDFFEKTGILFRGNMNYALRYNFTGRISGSYTRKNFEGSKQRRWNLDIYHNHTIDRNTRFSVNASFVSNNTFFQEFSNNRNQRLNRQLISNATFNKSWGQNKNSLSLNLSQTKDLETGRQTTTLPQLRFSRSQSALIPSKEGASLDEQKWYNSIRYSYQGSLVNTVRKDSTNDEDADTDRRVEHDIRMSFTNPGKVFGWLSLNQSFNYDEDWFDRKQSFSLVDSTNRFNSTDVTGFAARRTFQYSASANTNLYGTFSPKIGPITALRHKMSPSLSFSYRPDFSDPKWGYYQEEEDTTAQKIRLDKFGGTPRGKLMSLNYSLNNLFQMKLGEGSNEKKIDLFTLNFSSGYNFAADSLKFSNLTTSFRASPRRNLTISMGMSHSFYEFDTVLNRTVDRFRAPRLTRFNIDARWTLSGRKSQSNEAAQQRGASQGSSAPISQVGSTPQSQYEDRFAPDEAFSAFDIPWRANIAFSFNVSRSNPLRTTKNAYIDLSGVEVQLTRNWRIGYRLRYDLEGTEILDQRISFYRDLHCWEARFDWNPSGIGKGFYFKLNIKAPHLSSVKIEQRGGTTSVFNPF